MRLVGIVAPGVDPTRNLDQIKECFINRFKDSRDQCKYRLEVEDATRQEDELIKSISILLNMLLIGDDLRGYPQV